MIMVSVRVGETMEESKERFIGGMWQDTRGGVPMGFDGKQARRKRVDKEER